MTIKIPSDNIFDDILRLLGKKRKIIFPDNHSELKNDPYVTMMAKKESFWKALFKKNIQS